ncbi:hypothetical protein OH76DRAFT_1031037 [Lentinus brumalis]|uniref:Uncharacterized protein n=1 Tax=Lentinus brumalis TaxID=2498619 RepID=A0A371CXG0_9APHY|nr:hypothetical protein OH76DRAFT_1031037 [Polyporus brumalis]
MRTKSIQPILYRLPYPPPPKFPGQGDKLLQQVKPITICRRSAANEDCGDAVKEVVERMLVIVKMMRRALSARASCQPEGLANEQMSAWTYQALLPFRKFADFVATSRPLVSMVLEVRGYPAIASPPQASELPDVRPIVPTQTIASTLTLTDPTSGD